MKISYKKISTFIFALAFFLQSFGDGYYIAHGLEPSILKVAKYGLFVLGIVWGTYSTSGKDFHCYQKETFRILIAQFAIFIISLTLAIINNGNISNIFDQVFRYCIAILYAYVILNSFSLHEIYKLMEYIMIVSIEVGFWKRELIFLLWQISAPFLFLILHPLLNQAILQRPPLTAAHFLCIIEKTDLLL